MDDGRFSMRNMSLRRLSGFAYDIDASRIRGGPPWLEARYDMEAMSIVCPAATIPPPITR